MGAAWKIVADLGGRSWAAGFAAVVAVGGAAGGAARAQCIWNVFPVGRSFEYGGTAAFSTTLGRTLWVDPGFVPNPAVRAWDGAVWTAVGTASLGRREFFRVAFDSDRGRLVLFGGEANSAYPADTWEWDGASWARVATIGPAGRDGHVLVYDERRHRTVLFGGGNNTTGFHDTWEWDGTSWALVATAGPASAIGSCYAYDSLRGRTDVLTISSSNLQLWAWDGLAWTALPGPPRGGEVPYSMAYDRGRDRMIVSRSNSSGSFPLVDTLEFDPAAPALWTVRTVGTGTESFMVYDPVRARTVVPGFWTLEFDGTGTVVPPAVIVQPSSGGGRPGVTIMLSAVAAGSSLDLQWYKDGLALHDDGRISGATTQTLTILNGDPSDNGAYHLTISNPCGSEDSNNADVWVGIPPCYVNCDNSTTPPILNVNDFVCFLNRFAAGDSYADCDGSSIMPRLNVNDFICFQVRFLQGCP